MSGYNFKPASIKLSNVSKDIFNQNFTVTSVGIVSTTLNNQLQVYPNPTTGELTIENGYPISDIRLSDIVGREIFVESRTSDIGHPIITIDISHLASGLYFLKVGNKTVKVAKE